METVPVAISLEASGHDLDPRAFSGRVLATLSTAAAAPVEFCGQGQAALVPSDNRSFDQLPERSPTLSLDGLAVALSAYNIRDIAQCDPAMRIRHLKLLSCGPGTVVYRGTWQGLTFAVKFMLYRGSNPGAMQSRATALLATHCGPQRSHVARVYSFDVSEVLEAAETSTSLDDSCSDKAGQDPAGRQAATPHLIVRPYNCAAGPDSAVQPASPRCRGVTDLPAGGRRGGSQARFHFSSVVFADGPGPVAGTSASAVPAVATTPRTSEPQLPSASPPSALAHSASTSASAPATPTTSPLIAGQDIGATPAPPSSPFSSLSAPTLQGLLHQLGARPGDFLVHCVMELAPAGNLWYGIRNGVYDLHGRLGPLCALRMLVHSARGVAQGMQQLHQAGWVHGGLTPSNVLLQWSDEGEEGDGPEGVSTRDGARARGLTARISDCGMRRLVLDAGWGEQLQGNEELAHFCAPEIQRAAGAGGGGAVEWAPCHDVYAFGALLHAMCWGSQGGASPNPCPLSCWPQTVWPPLRSLGEACLATDPASRPRANEIIKTLLVLEQRLCCSSRMKHLSAAPGPHQGLGASSFGSSGRLRLGLAGGAGAPAGRSWGSRQGLGPRSATSPHDVHLGRGEDQRGNDLSAGRAGCRSTPDEAAPSLAPSGLYAPRSLPEMLHRTSAPAD